MYTLENSRCDCIRKENGKWGFYRDIPEAEFNTYEEAEEAIMEIKEQGIYVGDIEIVKW